MATTIANQVATLVRGIDGDIAKARKIVSDRCNKVATLVKCTSTDCNKCPLLEIMRAFDKRQAATVVMNRYRNNLEKEQAAAKAKAKTHAGKEKSCFRDYAKCQVTDRGCNRCTDQDRCIFWTARRKHKWGEEVPAKRRY